MVLGEAMLGVWERIAEVARLVLANPDMMVVRPNRVGQRDIARVRPGCRRTDTGVMPTGAREPAKDHRLPRGKLVHARCGVLAVTWKYGDTVLYRHVDKGRRDSCASAASSPTTLLG